MRGRLDETLEHLLTKRLRFYEDLGIKLFYRHRAAAPRIENPPPPEPPATSSKVDASSSKPTPASSYWKPLATAAKPAPKWEPLPVAQGPTLFEAAERVEGDTLEKIRADIGDCTRCRLSKCRNTIVFGDGSSRAELVFVGEGPGADEDAQGLPFVGRAGKLLTQMIEAMGLARKDVYICNVVKCRPPENHAVRPKVIVCLGSVAAQTLLHTNRGISHFRGEWLEYRGARLLATYHPAYLLRNPNAKGDVWKDLQKVMAVLGLTAKKGNPA